MSGNGAGETPPQLIKLNPKQPAQMATPSSVCWLQHKHNLLNGYPTIAAITGSHRIEPIAVVGGGPSLVHTMNTLKNFCGPRMACGSSHDFLLKNGVVLHYTAILDPDPIAANYLKEDGGDCIYLVASHVAPQVFWKLKGKRVFIFGAGGTFPEEDFAPIPIVWAGGRTVGTRAMGLALALGYTEMHLFGIDSCLADDQTHAYETESVAEPKPIYCNGKKFMCAPYMIGQATDFQHFMGIFGEQIGISVYGEGLISEIMKASQQEVA